MEYLEAVARYEAAGEPLAPGSDREQAAIDRFTDLLGDFKAPGFEHRIEEVYADELFFNDTLKTLHSAEAVARYLAESADALDSGDVEFLDLVSSNGNYYFRWRMDLRFKKLAKGRTTVTNGMTHIRFDADGKVVLHQDFWDSSAGLFEHIPGLGWMIRTVKQRL